MSASPTASPGKREFSNEIGKLCCPECGDEHILQRRAIYAHGVSGIVIECLRCGAYCQDTYDVINKWDKEYPTAYKKWKYKKLEKREISFFKFFKKAVEDIPAKSIKAVYGWIFD